MDLQYMYTLFVTMIGSIQLVNLWEYFYIDVNTGDTIFESAIPF